MRALSCHCIDLHLLSQDNRNLSLILFNSVPSPKSDCNSFNRLEVVNSFANTFIHNDAINMQVPFSLQQYTLDECALRHWWSPFSFLTEAVPSYCCIFSSNMFAPSNNLVLTLLRVDMFLQVRPPHYILNITINLLNLLLANLSLLPANFLSQTTPTNFLLFFGCLS